jgi:catechol 2,3-dioxygenase-like lactoylglutathione lyase family enzyme
VNRFDQDDPIRISGVNCTAIATRDLRRAIRFYRRVFGFQNATPISERGTAEALICVPGRAYLAVHECRDAMPRPSAWTFSVADLDEARERLWALGVVPAGGRSEPHPGPWPWRRSLSISDPDGNAIELVERDADLTARSGKSPQTPERSSVACARSLRFEHDSKQWIVLNDVMR